MKVAIFGASGFAGATLVEHLLGRADIETRALIHSSGNAWRLARTGAPMTVVDVTSPSQVSEALDGCTHVVNCTRGSRTVMFDGLKHMLAASKNAKIRRFVHLSSVAVYGDPPSATSEREEAPPLPAPRTYGEEKLQQDRMVADAAQAGLDCIVLCLPNISGVYSSFVCNVLSDMRKGSLGLVDGGLRPLNTVDVDNLAYAITLALHAAKGDGKRIFVTDGVGSTWKDLADALMPLAELSEPPPVISERALQSPPVERGETVSLWRSMKHLVSSDVREALRRDPLWAKFDGRLRRFAAAGGRNLEDRLRESIEGARKVAKVPDPYPYSSRYNAMQLRGVWHRIDRAHEVLGYKPPLDFTASTARFRLWYETMHGFGQQFWPLASVLNKFSGDGHKDRQS